MQKQWSVQHDEEGGDMVNELTLSDLLHASTCVDSYGFDDKSERQPWDDGRGVDDYRRPWDKRHLDEMFAPWVITAKTGK